MPLSVRKINIKCAIDGSQVSDNGDRGYLFLLLTSLLIMRAFVVFFFSNGKIGTIGRQISFKVLPMVRLVMPLVPMVPMLPTYGSKCCRQNTAWVILPTQEKSRDSIWRA